MSDATQFCSDCGAAIEGDDRFCGECGAPVGGRSAPPPPPSPSSPARRGLSGGAIGGIAVVVAAAAVGGTLLLTGGSDNGASTTSTAPVAVSTSVTTVATSDVTEPVVDPLLATDLEGVRQATIHIEMDATVVDPAGGSQSGRWYGSGFLIDSSGLAVTNNHVVTGASLLEVWVEGKDRPVNARILGISECSDLAVIQLDGDGYQYLDWYDGDITTGLAIYAAGFPLGTPEYTLLDGIISKEQAEGETDWASVDAVLEHTAETLSGSSGGPIVTEDGRVVAINYSGDSVGQTFAISMEVAIPEVARLVDGNVNSIGINGRAIQFDDGTSGIWVYSVDAGSIAGRAGILPGDVIVEIENVLLGTDGTLSAYCDVLRSHDDDDVLSVEVWRPSDGLIYVGRLNDRPLEPESTPIIDVETPPDAATPTEAFVSLIDDTGLLTVDVPATWTDVSSQSWGFPGVADAGPSLWAAPDLSLFWEFAVPGVWFGVTSDPAITVEGILDWEDYQTVCTFEERQDYFDGVFEGFSETWVDCFTTDATLVVIAAETADGSTRVFLDIMMVEDADVDALIQIVGTFNLLSG